MEFLEALGYRRRPTEDRLGTGRLAYWPIRNAFYFHKSDVVIFLAITRFTEQLNVPYCTATAL